ncbi:activating transcription factor 7-interacting protein 1 isoform X2 [Cololabis saira]|uniref:activating transcription factor 7-interacting protein 1 isoform X2 n=1 Tax=Cololabis saira TaxID=129043 RepID=UPI002AD453E0|nr:activating transcription factor 7-interacting protein 1 isoform X2 [Cololabis saira]
MEVVVTEEKKKIFRARKTMKISDRLQLDSLHTTLLTAPSLSNPSPPPLVNGTHKEDGQKMEGDEKQRSSPSSESVAAASTEQKDQEKNDSEGITMVEKKQEKRSPKEVTAGASVTVSGKDSASSSPVPPAASEYTEPMETESDTTKTAVAEASTSLVKDKKPSSLKAPSPSSSACHPTSTSEQKHTSTEVTKAEVKEEDDKADVKKGPNSVRKTEMNSVKMEAKKEETDIKQISKSSRPSSVPPFNTAREEKSSTSGLKRTLSEGNEEDVKKEGKRPKVEDEELEAQLELKITAKAGSHHKLEKIVQNLVEERLKILQLNIFDKHFQELKDRVDKIDCATKHQTAINTLQSKISRLSKKFGEANQASENKRKQEALAAASAAAAAASAAAAITAAKSAVATNNIQAQRQVRTSIEVKPPPTVSSSSSAVVPVPASLSVCTTTSAPTSTSTTVVPQASILQLITSSANAASTLANAITTQSQTGTLVLKTASGSSMMAAGQPLVIQLPLSVNGQTGTLVNFPVSSLSAAGSLSKSKTSASTTTFILKSPPTSNAASTSISSAATLPALPALQPSPGQVPTTAQISLTRPVYQGGAGGITTPNAGISVTTARTPAQSVSVVGAMSSVSSPATSGPAATGSTAPGPPQGTSLTSKTDNQATGSTPSKPAMPTVRPKGSVIDLTEDDDDVQVTGVKKATASATVSTTVSTASPAPRPNPVISVPTSMLTVNSDLRGGLTMDEWIECPSAEKKTNKRRHADLTSGEVDQLDKEKSEAANTVKQTRWAVKCFEDWCKDKGLAVDFQTVSKKELNDILREFYGTVRNFKGDLYGLSSYTGIRAGLNRYVSDPPLSLSWCLLKDKEFKTSNNVFAGVVNMLRKNGLDTIVHHTSITNADLNTIKRVLNPNTPTGLVNKVWFDTQLHFGRRGKEGNRQLKPSSFVIKTDERGLKYATLTHEDAKNHDDPEGRNRERVMYQLPGDPLCPVSSLEKYLSVLPPDAPAFYLHARKEHCNLDKVWFTREPMGVNHLSTMLPRICKEAGTQHRYTNLCLHSTPIEKLSDAGLNTTQICYGVTAEMNPQEQGHPQKPIRPSPAILKLQCITAPHRNLC